MFGPTVQGEGKNAGKPVAFLRLANCNLHCFKCDTEFTWNFENRFPHVDGKLYKRKDEIHPMSVEAIVEKLESTGMKHLVMSGGEPFMQQKHLTPLAIELKKLGWFIEVETNGTLKPLDSFVATIDQINCSPKLDSEFSGEPLKMRIREGALKALAGVDKVNFKFVICDEGNMTEALALIKKFGMKEVRLMPECRTKDEMYAKEPWVRKLCEDHGFIYCTRLSIEMSGLTRGV